MSWAYGITTVPERQHSYFSQTLESLIAAGFDTPTIFVDGSSGDYSKYDLPVVHRSSKIQAFGNWALAMYELWIRNPKAQRFALFQDDMVTYRNLKQYLDRCEMPPHTYWNLYTFPQNENLCKGERGWYHSNQRGRGAVALVFSAPVVYKLMTAEKFFDKPRANRNPHRSIDGVICDSLIPQGVKEMVHYPTLTQHIGECSSIGNPQHSRPDSWLGQEYDATEMLYSIQDL